MSMTFTDFDNIFDQLCEVVVLDYSSGRVEFFHVHKDLCNEEHIEDVLTSIGFNLDEISYMYSDNKEIPEIHHNMPILNIKENE